MFDDAGTDLYWLSQYPPYLWWWSLYDQHHFMMLGCAGEACENGFAFVDDRWTWCQCVAPEDFEDWKRNLISATVRERQPVGIAQDPVTGRRFLSLFDAIRRFSNCRTPLLGLAGQRVSRGYVRALRAAGIEWMRHYLDLAHETGLLPRSGPYWTHCWQSEALQSFASLDLLNMPSLDGIAVWIRCVASIEMTMTRNPLPEHDDLDPAVSSAIHENGIPALPVFTPFIVRAQEAQAFALERQLELRQELQDAQMGRAGGAMTCVIEESIEAGHIQREGSSEDKRSRTPT